MSHTARARDLLYDLRESAQALDTIADFCRPLSMLSDDPASQMTAAQPGPVLCILARVLAGHVEAMEQALSG